MFKLRKKLIRKSDKKRKRSPQKQNKLEREGKCLFSECVCKNAKYYYLVKRKINKTKRKKKRLKFFL